MSPLPRHRYQTFLFFGAPGSGKGTQGVILGRIPRFTHFACGDVFRSLDTRTPLGQAFVEYSSKGQLVPDELTVQLWEANIRSRADSHLFKPDIDFLILDGIPRNVGQAVIMEQHLDVMGVFHLSCPNRDELRRRLRKRALKDNRFDDARDDVIERRIQTYEAETKPVLEYYSSGKYAHSHLIHDIDATKHPAIVAYEILNSIIHLPAWQRASEKVY
ncbi:MAG: nucleoside monophosphate kinase [Verrucomicrobiaceae bacterium]|nr:MAG: nucleoside monophosphate kinase [Verrucomicrobiaceae bacterium]